MSVLHGVLDRLRGIFVYVVALVLPLAGVILAIARYVDGDRDEAIRIAAFALLGMSVLVLVFA